MVFVCKYSSSDMKMEEKAKIGLVYILDRATLTIQKKNFLLLCLSHSPTLSDGIRKNDASDINEYLSFENPFHLTEILLQWRNFPS